MVLNVLDLHSFNFSLFFQAIFDLVLFYKMADCCPPEISNDDIFFLSVLIVESRVQHYDQVWWY